MSKIIDIKTRKSILAQMIQKDMRKYPSVDDIKFIKWFACIWFKTDYCSIHVQPGDSTPVYVIPWRGNRTDGYRPFGLMLFVWFTMFRIARIAGGKLHSFNHFSKIVEEHTGRKVIFTRSLPQQMLEEARS